MDLFGRLTRVFMRRKYARVDEERDKPAERLTKSSSMRIPRETRAERKLRQQQQKQQQQADAPVAALPKKFTLRSSSNDVIDGAWFNSALRRSVAEGRVTLSS